MSIKFEIIFWFWAIIDDLYMMGFPFITSKMAWKFYENLDKCKYEDIPL